MKFRKWIVPTGVTASAVLALFAQVYASGDKVAFPADYDKGVLYHTVDHERFKQYRELWTTPEAIDAAKKGEPLPSGTVITMVNYAAKLDADGNPEKDANGRFIKTDELAGYSVMEKRTGWGTEYPDEIRNGEWEYQAFTADRKVNEKVDLKACFTCHKPLDKDDYVFTYDQLKSASR